MQKCPSRRTEYMCRRRLACLCKKLNIRCVTRGTDPIPENARADDFKLKQALWRENEKDIRLEIDQKEKVRDIVMPQKKIERNYLANQILVQIHIPNSQIGQAECRRRKINILEESNCAFKGLKLANKDLFDQTIGTIDPVNDAT